MIKRLAVFLLGFSFTGWSATYYIDYEQGLNANNGLSRAAAWKHAPGMTGFTGTYSHSAGDTFVFKGGVTWDHACLPLTITAGGTAAKRDYYGADSTWFNGGSFTRPVFDGEGLVNQLISTRYASYFTLANLELTGEMMTDAGGGNATISIYNADQGHVLMQYLQIHNWNRCTGPGTPTSACTQEVTDNSGSGGGIYNSIFSGLSMEGVVVDQCDIGNPENGGDIGACARGIDILSNSVIHDASQGILHGGRLVYNNVFYNVGKTFDGVTHTNVTYIDCHNGGGIALPSGTSVYVYNNLMYDCPTNQVIYPNPGSSGVSSAINYYIYNNVAYNNGGMSVHIDPYGAPAGYTANVYMFNNTFQLPQLGHAYPLIRVVTRTGTPAPEIVQAENNHFIADQDVNACIQWENTPVSGQIASHNAVTTHAQATAQGYTPGNQYAPTAASTSTFDAGREITPGDCPGCTGILSGFNGVSRPQGPGWDLGAYEYAAPAIADGGFAINRSLARTLPNPLRAGSWHQLFTAHGDLLFRDLAGKAIGHHSPVRPGIYLVEKKGTGQTQKVVVIR